MDNDTGDVETVAEISFQVMEEMVPGSLVIFNKIGRLGIINKLMIGFRLILIFYIIIKIFYIIIIQHEHNYSVNILSKMISSFILPRQRRLPNRENMPKCIR